MIHDLGMEQLKFIFNTIKIFRLTLYSYKSGYRFGNYRGGKSGQQRAMRR